MKFVFDLKNKIKIAMLLFAVTCCSLLIRFLEDKSIKKINESFVSMYNDRLIPAVDLYVIGEHLYFKNEVLQNALIFNDYAHDTKTVQLNLSKLNKNIDSVILKYERTLLVKQEAVFLNDLKSTLQRQHKIENDILLILSSNADKARIVYEAVGRSASTDALNKLSALIGIQTKVGDELLKDSNVVVTGTNIYSALQVVLAILIGVLIVLIITSTNSAKLQQNKFDLN